MSELVKRCILLVLGLAFGLVLAEIICRVIYTRPWYERLVIEQLRPDRAVGVWKNSLGLRDRDYRPVKDRDCRRVLILGDSFTFGYGVADNAAVFPELLERRLNAELATQGRRVEILNGGIVASLSANWLDLHSRVRDTFQPDVVLVVFFLRCGTRTTVVRTFFGPIRNEILERNQRSRLYRYSYTYRTYRDERDRRLISARYARALTDSYFGNETQTEEWRLAQANVRKMRDLAAGAHATMGLVVFPVLVELNDRYPFKGIVDEVLRYGRENGIPTHDLLPAFLGQSGPDLWISAADQHPNAQAHRIAAEAILPFLRELLERHEIEQRAPQVPGGSETRH